MRNVAVIGTGGIGSRHLQALAQLDLDARITAIDPSVEALATARARFEAGPTNDHVEGVTYATSLDALPPPIDVAIVATLATVRLEVARQLFARCRVSYLVLEKVLAQHSRDVDTLCKAVVSAGARAWVNCPRRIFRFHQRLRRRLEGLGPLELTASGGEWALCSNGIHVLDLVAFLSGERLSSLDSSRLDPTVLDSARRPRFKELTGTLVGHFDRGTRVVMSSKRGDPRTTLDWHIRSADGAVELVVDEMNRRATFSRGNLEAGDKASNVPVDMPYQSELTHQVVREICERGSSGLASLEESASFHRPYLDELLDVFRRLDPAAGFEVVPIT